MYYMQIYLPLQKQNLENGGLKPKSHSSTSNNSPIDRKACVLLNYKIN